MSLKTRPPSTPVNTRTRIPTASGPWSASSANGAYVPAISTKIIEWSSRRIDRRADPERHVI
jgi:hypothetical protein